MDPVNFESFLCSIGDLLVSMLSFQVLAYAGIFRLLRKQLDLMRQFKGKSVAPEFAFH
jgi:hypothetical protein